ncbi:MAG TPA: dockerin type I domain-containing protein [Pirellulales bacterium]|jgi:hypothetical protein
MTVPAGLKPGDQYRLVFVTSTTTEAASSDIGYYNSFVSNAASLEPLLQTLGTTWTALASTSTVAANDNTNTNPMSAGLPIYGLAGQLIATSNSDLWDGAIAAPILDNEHGTPVPSGFNEVWTGTGATGKPDEPDDPLGTPTPAWGDSTTSTINWVDTGGYYESGGTHTLYAISGPLTVVSGDANQDGLANAQDIAVVASEWLKSGTNLPGDVNGDGEVNSADLAVISANWLQNAGNAAASASPMVVAAVPEPSTLALAALSSLALLALRRS